MGFGMAGAAYQSCARECGLVCEFKRLKTHETKCHLVSCALSLLMAHTGRAILLRTRSVQNMHYIKLKTRLTRNENIGQSFGVMVFCLAGPVSKKARGDRSEAFVEVGRIAHSPIRCQHGMDSL